ncbi:MAG: TRAP transporter permease [Spirochaetaceae bacterium]|nr:TRAP transporter permease [Spirochaetaceae bacterium]
MRATKGFTQWVIVVLALSLAVFHLSTGLLGIFESRVQRGVHLLFAIPLAFLLFPAVESLKDRPVPWYDWVLAVLSALPSLYVVLFRKVLNARWEYTTHLTTVQIVLGFVIVLTLIEAVRRASAPALAIFMVIALVELVFGQYFPGILGHRRLRLERIIEACYLLTEAGIYGYITGTSAVFVAMFVILGAFINKVGLGQYFIDLAFRIAGKSAGGPAKVAVISSGFFGSISGSATANVFATGIFTIPMMKKLGYRKEFAGAVEAAASTGGGLVPPVMGAAVFIMAQITQIPYITICIAAIPTAFFYYLSVFLSVHFEAKKMGLTPQAVEGMGTVSWKSLARDSYLLLPIVILTVFLVNGYSPTRSALVAIFACIAVSMFKKETRMTPRRFIETLIDGGKSIVMIAVSCAAAGLIVCIISATGLGLNFTAMVVDFAHGRLLVALLLTMAACIVMGMGLPTTASYVLTIAIGGPILLELGGEILAVHMFVFYFAILATVTPPIAMAAYAGASLAGGKPMATAFLSCRLAIVGYIVPYLFFFNNGVLLQGGALNVIVCLIVALEGVVFVAYAAEGWLFTHMGIVERILMGILAIVIPFPIIPNSASLVAGTGAIALICLWQWRKARRLAIAQQ